MFKVYTTELAGRELSLEFGKYCGQANGSVIVRLGDTVVMVNATAAEKPREGQDFFPLSVDFEEKMYAVGKIPGGFIKREGRPSEKATLTSRLIDRPLRPLFNKGIRNDVQVVATVLSVEQDVIISKLPRMSAYDIRDSLINDLNTWIVEKKALDWKPTNSDENRQQYRCGAALGLYLAGKFCLWNERWTEAVEYFGYLEEIYGNGAGMPEGALAKYPLSDIPFSRRNTPEVILEVSNISVEYGLQLYGNLASY
ncbi:MAG: hypothetical protein IJB85_06625, partial [Clostridia bacterium]|nr:hypothetical protein [Clostridia bacterium]